jgi:DNA-directed RNA polymerase II subunit RPB2
LADRAPEVLRSYYADHPLTFLTNHHVQSYESFVFRELLDILHAANPITILKEPLDAAAGKYKYRAEIYVGGDKPTAAELGVYIAAPTVTLDAGKTIRRMFPNEARLRNLTYSATYLCDILVRMTFTSLNERGEYVETTKEIRFEGDEAYPLFKIPILLRSKVCATHGASKELLFEMGECRQDAGGYFIVRGSEKVLIARQEQAFNSIFVAQRPAQDLEMATYASVTCQDPASKQKRRIALIRFHENRRREEGVLHVAIPFVKGTIPLFALFRAMGVESDKEIVSLIIPSGNTAMELALLPSIHDAWPIVTKQHAIEFIRTLTNGFQVEHVLDILQNNVFTHVPQEAKPQYLAELVRKMLRVEMGMEPPTHRDDIRNQRLLGTGAMLRDLFADIYKVWKKAVILYVDKEYTSNKTLYQDENFLSMFADANIDRVLSPEVIQDALMRGFGGKWGTNQYNMKVGVVQPLARISYLDMASHTRRVVLDFDTSMKQVGPRHLHPSQAGYFCTSETPTGGHIGITKNMSMLTAISIVTPSAPVISWLYTKGGVTRIGDATPKMRSLATSVQVNGGTIGFTLRPDVLTTTLKMMKWTACLSPTASISFNTPENVLRIYLDDGRPLRPLYHLIEGKPHPAALATPLPPWRDLLCGTFPPTKERTSHSSEFFDPLADKEAAPLEEYLALLAPYSSAIEYVDPYEGNEIYVSWWGSVAEMERQYTHSEIHPSSLTGLMTSMIPFANHNQSPRNQLSCSQSKQAIGYYATNYDSRFDTYASLLCYGEAPLARTLTFDAVAGGEMAYGTNVIFAINSFNGYNQDDGILFNRTSIERGLFRSLSLRSYSATEEEDPLTQSLTRMGNPRDVSAWTDLKPGRDYSGLDENGVIKEGTVIHDKSVLVGMYVTNKETGRIYDASVLPTVFTKGRVDKVAVLHQPNGFRLVHVRIIEERIPELGDKFCLTPDHDVLTKTRGWVPVADVTTADIVYCLDPKTDAITYEHPICTVSFDCVDEPMYTLESQQVDLCTTMNHKMWVQVRGKSAYELVEAKEVMGKRVRYQKTAKNINPDYVFTIPDSSVTLPIEPWLEFLGLWVSDGWVAQGKPLRGRTEGELRIVLTALVPEHRAQLHRVCTALGLHIVEEPTQKEMIIYHHEIAKYLQTFSVGANHKRLPAWVFELSEAQSRQLLHGLLSGDGYTSKRGALCYYTSSKGLCEDVQRLCLHAGYSANVSVAAGREFVIEGRAVHTNADAWLIRIVRTKNHPMVRHTNTQNKQRESITSYTGSVHCLEVPNHVFYVRRNGKPVWTGNSSRHGQKGTMGMLMNAEDMPRTAEGLVPDVMVNPHCIPSRMTIAQLLEQVYGKLGAIVGAKMNATTFMNNEDSFSAIANVLEAIGYQREGEEIMYSGITGQQLKSSIFIGPLYYMRLKHLTQDKLNARSSGRKEMLTHQPTGGRGNEGGMRVGEMERDSLIAHGVASFFQETMMKRSDGAEVWVCNGCGTIPIVNEEVGLYLCPVCDGPIKDNYTGKTAETLTLTLPVRQSRTTFTKVEMPYSMKLLDQEIARGQYQMRYLTEQNARAFREGSDRKSTRLNSSH